MRALSLLLPLLLLLTTACNSQTKVTNGEADTSTITTVESQALSYRYAPPATPGVVEPMDTTEAYWREILSPQAYEVLREDGTERSFTSPLNDEKRPGVFACAACGLPLFSSSTKFNSGTGWPSFYEPIDPAYIKEDEDFRYGVRRVEVSCARCDGHQGHVFPDGPDPTGLRYCINGVSLNFVPQADLK